MKSVTFQKHYSPTLVQEFYSILTLEIKSNTASGYHQIFLRGKTVKFSPEGINDFLECPTIVENGVYVYNDDFEHSDDIIIALTGGKCSSWGLESRLSTSKLTLKYNVLFKLGAFNWSPTTHNSSILKEMTMLLYAIVTGKQFNLGQFIFDRITYMVNVTSTVNHLAYLILITQFMMQSGVPIENSELVTGIKKLKISPKLFGVGKIIDLPVGKHSSMAAGSEDASAPISDDCEKLLEQ
ncbi:uncharacterized protein LOC120256496 [Dioscorea cayenensis subsp. rotundata]|uniref:Uncharacterized protein LOC120256496 n=1 Tax=Dioscorea cayennensis subsp. rotundata TaxID=55577 RepID=A0AB40AZ90_DIOCR|nr:uncharacterized protein LOC120256496 [Dioscorea cayenensis subsp. rotundata]